MLDRPTNLRKEIRLERDTHYRKPAVGPKDVKSRFTPGARLMPKTSQIVVRNEETLGKALEIAADVGAVIVEVEGTKYFLEGPEMLKKLQKIVEDELAEGRCAIVSHWRSRAGYMSSEVGTIFKGQTASNRLTVKDPGTYTEAMDMVRKGPVRIFGRKKSWIITRPDQLQQILHDQIDKKRTVGVAPYELPKQVGESVVKAARKPLTVVVPKDYVAFRDEAGLRRAFKMLRESLTEPNEGLFSITSGGESQYVNTYPEALQVLQEVAQVGKLVIVERLA